jgi:hypothetical protein
VAYDDDALYVVIDAWESHRGGVRASTMIRDDDAPGDFVNVLLDTFGDRQTAVNFSTTPGGNRNDWTISGDAQSTASFSPAWNGVWISRPGANRTAGTRNTASRFRPCASPPTTGGSSSASASIAWRRTSTSA